ncbi:putative G-protein coupled receptor 83-like protein [Leptotrombidium deliense]|uniref:Putative G-protein coupled receptor 83-like protein n=1 Tax=Leptotrombidium deliense TaxID=299467 RepID=A0A443RV86_9ACAR|nr:putative G-protein coupled receptor 83-like protein [Leptotrombidium deliense]
MSVTNAKDGYLEVDSSNDTIRDVLILFLYFCTALFAIITNGLVYKIVMNNKQMQTKTNLLIASMAVSDILAGITIPAQWLFCSHALLFSIVGEIVCGIFKSLQVITYFVSTLTMVAIAIHRIWATFHRSGFGIVQIRFPVKAAIISTWVFAVVTVAMTSVSIKIYKYFTPEAIISCGVIFEFDEPFKSRVVRKLRVMFTLLGQFLVPLLLTALLYAIIIILVFCCRKIVGKSKKKTILMLVTH